MSTQKECERKKENQWIRKKLRLVYYFTSDTSNECRWWLGKITTKCGCPFFLRSVTDMWIGCVTMSLLVLRVSVSLKKTFLSMKDLLVKPWHSVSAHAQDHSAPVGMQVWKIVSNQKIKPFSLFWCFHIPEVWPGSVQSSISFRPTWNLYLLRFTESSADFQRIGTPVNHKKIYPEKSCLIVH